MTKVIFTRISPQIRLALILAITIGCFPSYLAHAGESCLRYGTVTLSGKLQRLTFPGAPNYESVAKGDKPETGFYLALSNAICADADAKNEARENVKLIQLVLDKKEYSRLRPSLGKYVTIGGALFSSFTGHHHAPLLLEGVTTP